ncbi:putative NAD(P)H dehydrogenase (quinone) [Helianthus anomalus]
MKAPPKLDDVPMISLEQLIEAYGFSFVFPSRFGVMTTQCKAFFYATNSLWETQGLAGKPVVIFWSMSFHGGNRLGSSGKPAIDSQVDLEL